MPANDHIVPQMYLKRFASAAKGRAPITTAAPVGNLTASFPASVKNVAAIRDFYWGTDRWLTDHDWSDSSQAT